jgi:hypothetical protein
MNDPTGWPGMPGRWTSNAKSAVDTAPSVTFYWPEVGPWEGGDFDTKEVLTARNFPRASTL